MNYPKSKAQGNAEPGIRSHDSDALSKHIGNVTQWLEAAFLKSAAILSVLKSDSHNCENRS